MNFFPIFKHALMISFFVFVMMLFVDFIDMASKGRMSSIIKGGRWRQYTLASFLGSTPGCLGAFMNVNLYVHGMISFGAIVGGMIATSGNEAFVMLSQFPGTALAIFVLLLYKMVTACSHFFHIVSKIPCLLRFLILFLELPLGVYFLSWVFDKDTNVSKNIGVNKNDSKYIHNHTFDGKHCAS